MKLIRDENKITGWAVESDNGMTETIHINHTGWECVEDAKEDIWAPFLVAEEATNYARLHLVCDSCDDYAAQEVQTYLDHELDNPEDGYHIIGVFDLEIKE